MRRIRLAVVLALSLILVPLVSEAQQCNTRDVAHRLADKRLNRGEEPCVCS